MNFIIWIVLGGVIGWLASMVMKTNKQMGIIANVLVGIVGSSLGFFLAGMLGLGGGQIVSFVLAVIGAAALIAVLKALGIFK